MDLEINKNSLNQALDGLDKAGEDLVKKLMDELITTGFLIESSYKLNVLVDTGRLKSSIHTEYKRKGKQAEGGNQFKPDDDQVKVGTNVVYAPYVEFKFENLALTNAYQKETAGLIQRLKKIIDASGK